MILPVGNTIPGFIQNENVNLVPPVETGAVLRVRYGVAEALRRNAVLGLSVGPINVQELLTTFM